MGEADPATSRGNQAPAAAGDALRLRLDRLVARSQAAGLWETAWPILWRGIAVLLAFLILSWLGLWLDLPPLGRMVGLGLFALALVAVLLPLARLRRGTAAKPWRGSTARRRPRVAWSITRPPRWRTPWRSEPAIRRPAPSGRSTSPAPPKPSRH